MARESSRMECQIQTIVGTQPKANIVFQEKLYDNSNSDKFIVSFSYDSNSLNVFQQLASHSLLVG